MDTKKREAFRQWLKGLSLHELEILEVYYSHIAADLEQACGGALQ